ncbi:hypothetical protein [Roseiconus lacunae]|uniref:hypothetical protein n=1 Tax=Roseiconus lacunae TaxID=2605694 RepID=UPI001E3FF8A8|nr:hypothetical protein [Roseiconus lacunae]MCD0459262.1 hypothetical protein [Roseiconus lacunae]
MNSTNSVAIGEEGQFILARTASFAKSDVENQVTGIVKVRTPINVNMPEATLMRARQYQIITAAVIVMAKHITGTIAKPVWSNPMRKQAMITIHAELPIAPPNQPPAFHRD